MKSKPELKHLDGTEIAIVGMAGRFPRASSIEEFWNNLRKGEECVTRFTDEQLRAAGVPAAALQDPAYVKARPTLEGIELFDAEFFGFNPREAEGLDPQQRIFLECVWEALEHSGYVPSATPAIISLFGGVSTSSYLTSNLYANPEALTQIGLFQAFLSNVQDSLATRAAYKLNLKGGCYSVQTFCSTSLVAVHMSCQALADLECDLALAGGVSINVPQNIGYWYQEGGILSPDGHCRAFDAKAQGTLFGNGAGVVVLKRLEDALADGDTIHAVIKGSATNNDGSMKVSYTAPSVNGQAQVIVEAMGNAGVEPETISYVEAHGTGTQLGDPTEVSALTKAFRSGTSRKGFCAIGSVKTNIGHLDAAAGIASLIKVVMALKHRQIPPSLHYEKPNTEIDFPGSPFFVNTKLTEWAATDLPRRAGVSSFGIGGTNAHVILQEAPELPRAATPRSAELLVLSARSAEALEAATQRLAAHLKAHPHEVLQDVAYTLQVGREPFGHRRIVVPANVDEAVRLLEGQDPKRVFTQYQEQRNPSVVFLFPGQGSQHVDMGRGLYSSEPVFRQHLDSCAELLRPHLGIDLRQVLYPEASGREAATERLSQTAFTQPALFAIEYAMAKLWMSWGFEPKAMIGHSIGEYVAACLAGVFSLSDALMLVARRAALMQKLPAGNMAAVPLSGSEVQARLGGAAWGRELSIAAVNGPSFCVVSGPAIALDLMIAALGGEGVECRPLHTSHAFHSAMMDPILPEFKAAVAKLSLKAPALPYLSNLTGTWIRPEEATNPDYWVKHLRGTVRYSDGILELAKEPNRLLLEIGPGNALCSLVKQHKEQALPVVPTMRHPQDSTADVTCLLTAVGRAWQAGCPVVWSHLHGKSSPRRIPLPTYPFERRRFWVDPVRSAGASRRRSNRKREVAEWFYVPGWKSVVPPSTPATPVTGQSWLILHQDGDIGASVAEALQVAGHTVATAVVGTRWEELPNRRFRMDPTQATDYEKVLSTLVKGGFSPGRILHLWSAGSAPNGASEEVAHGLESLVLLARGVSKQSFSEPVRLVVVSRGVQEVTGDDPLRPHRSMLMAACKVIPQECPSLMVQHLDLDGSSESSATAEWTRRFLTELCTDQKDAMVAWRGRQRWVQTYDPLSLPSAEEGPAAFRDKGVYWITGGLGGVSLVFAEHLARRHGARLVLTGRSELPPRPQWDTWLKEHPAGDGVSRRIRQVRALEGMGAEVLFLAADVADLTQMRRVVEQAKTTFGALHGVIHAAGVLDADTFVSIEEITPDVWKRQFQPKVAGLEVLDQVLRGEALDFCLLTSSLSSILGGLNYCAYAAANIFMDTFARLKSRESGFRWLAVNWDEWNLAAETADTPEPRSSVAQTAIRRTEGMEAFARVLRGASVPQIVVSTTDLQARIDQWIRLEGTKPAEASGSSSQALSAHARPNISTAYAPPTTEAETAIVGMWQQLLGIERVGINDNFFELGGHSLLATQLISRLRKTFEVELPLRIMFEATTVAEQAKRIETLRWVKSNQSADAAPPAGEREEIEL